MQGDKLGLGGLALLLPADADVLPASFVPGSEWPNVQVELDRDSRFSATLALQHLRPNAEPDGSGHQLGFTFAKIEPAAAQSLQRFIDQTQKVGRMLKHKPGG